MDQMEIEEEVALLEEEEVEEEDRLTRERWAQMFRAKVSLRM
jgi:hypothetical protein